MHTVYLNEHDFNRIKPIERFPNPNIVKAVIGGVIARVHKATEIEIRQITDIDGAAWYGVPLGCYIGVSKDGFFPTDLLTGTNDRGFYCENSDLAKITGWKAGKNLGTASEAFINLNEATRILKANNYKISLLS